MRIAVPAKGPGPDDRVDPGLAQAQYLVIHDTHDGTWKAVRSRPGVDARGGTGRAVAEILAEHYVDVVLCGAYGPEEHLALQNVGIRVRDGACGTVREAVDRFLPGTPSSMTLA